jgi:hypothetical protein
MVPGPRLAGARRDGGPERAQAVRTNGVFDTPDEVCGNAAADREAGADVQARLQREPHGEGCAAPEADHGAARRGTGR